MEKSWQASWLTDSEFLDLEPRNVFHREHASSAAPEEALGPRNIHMLARRVFTVPASSGRAHLDITADDYYKLYVNGVFVGQGPAPAYPEHYYYNRWDITGFLQPGVNCIAVHVYYQGLVNRVWNSGDHRQGFIAELFVDDHLLLASDASWRVQRDQRFQAAEPFGYETQFPEHMDERRLAKGWREVTFDDSLWAAAAERPGYDHQLYLQPTPPLEVSLRRPVLVELVDEGRFFIDVGEEVTGSLTMDAAGLAGQVVELRCGEECLPGSAKRVRWDLRCGCQYREFWTLSGLGDTLEHFDYKAFRYAEILDPHGAVDPATIRVVVRHYPMSPEASQCRSSQPLLDDIWQMCQRGVQYGSQEGFLDCPTREKGQYLGDLTVTAHSHIYLSGDLRLFRKALTEFAMTQRIAPGLLAVAPGSFMQEIADFSLQWPEQLLRYYQHSGDRDFLQAMYPTVEGILQYFRRFQRRDGLLDHVHESWNLLDWPENLRDGYDFPLTKPVGPGVHNVINAFFSGMLAAVNDIRRALGLDVSTEAAQARQAFQRAFFNEETGLFVDAEGSHHSALHSNALPLYFGLVPAGRERSVAAFVRRRRLSCGVYMAYFVLKGLARVGQPDAVYQLLMDTSEHSWANMLREGATTCFEAWGKDQKWNTSLCHPWASAPISVLIEDLAGVKPGGPGWSQVQFCPRLPDELTSLHLAFLVPDGTLQVEADERRVRLSGMIREAVVDITRKRGGGCE